MTIPPPRAVNRRSNSGGDFTEAATAELRDRIRARIHAARLAFARGQSDDAVIKPLLAEIDDHRQAAQILLQAERQMDEAAVYTIHGFCQRMLSQNAFESGSRFNNEFVTDESQLKAQVVADYWRRNFYPLPQALAAEVRQLWSSPAALLAEIGRYLTGAPLKLTVAPMTGSLAELHQANLEKIADLKARWRAVQDDLMPLISASDVNKRSYSKNRCQNGLPPSISGRRVKPAATIFRTSCSSSHKPNWQRKRRRASCPSMRFFSRY